MKQSKKDIIYEILRFLIVGGIATIFDYIVYYTCKLVIFKDLKNTPREIICVALGFLTGLIINWVLQRFVYKYIDKNTNKNKKAFVKFFIVSIIGLAITEVGMLLAKPSFDRLYLTIIFRFDFWNLFFKCLMTCIVLIWNYLARKFYVFKDDLNKIEK